MCGGNIGLEREIRTKNLERERKMQSNVGGESFFHPLSENGGGREAPLLKSF